MTKRMKDPNRPRFFWVVCADYVLGPYSDRERAQRILDGVVDFGACTLPHAIEETRSSYRSGVSRY